MAASTNEMERLQISDTSTESYQQCQSRALQALQRFGATRDAAHIEKATTYGRKANDLAADDPSLWAGARTILGVILVQRAQWSKDVADIEEATKMCRGAVEAVIGSEEHSEDEETTSAMFTNLLTTLRLRYTLAAQSRQTLDDGIAVLEDILPLTPLGSLSRRLCLGASSNFLNFASTETDSSIYEDRALGAARDAFALEHDTSVASSSLNQLISSLLKRHMRTQSPSDFREAVEISAPVIERDDHPSHSSPAYGDLLGNLCDLHMDRFKVTNDIELLRKAIDLNARLLILQEEQDPDEDPRRWPMLIMGLRQKISQHITATDTMPSDINIGLLLQGPRLMGLLVPDDYPNEARWLHDTAQRLRQHCEDVARSESTAETALITSMVAMSKMDPEHEDWGMVEDGYRANWKLWSPLTGKMPEFGISVMAFEGKRSTWLPPEIAEDRDLGITIPCMIYPGKLDPEKEAF